MKLHVNIQTSTAIMEQNKKTPFSTKKFPVSAQETLGYMHALERTDTYFHTLSLESDKPQHAIERGIGGIALSITAGKIARSEAPEAHQFNKEYATLLDTIPGYMSVVGKSTRNEKLTRQDKRNIIPLNHAIKEILDSHQSMTHTELLEMINRGIRLTGFNDAQDAVRDIDSKIIPGMMHELAGTANLYDLPEYPIVEDTTVEDELAGVDARLIYDDGVELTIDFKKSSRSAEEAQARHDEYRYENGLITPDNHLILWTGYTKTDFLPSKVGRVKPEARAREQPRIDKQVQDRHLLLQDYKANSLTQ